MSPSGNKDEQHQPQTGISGSNMSEELCNINSNSKSDENNFTKVDQKTPSFIPVNVASPSSSDTNRFNSTFSAAEAITTSPNHDSQLPPLPSNQNDTAYNSNETDPQLFTSESAAGLVTNGSGDPASVPTIPPHQNSLKDSPQTPSSSFQEF